MKYISHFNSDNVLSAMKQIVDTYNNTNHRIFMNHKPIDIRMLSEWTDIKSLSQKIYKSLILKCH